MFELGFSQDVVNLCAGDVPAFGELRDIVKRPFSGTVFADDYLNRLNRQPKHFGEFSHGEPFLSWAVHAATTRL